MTYRTKAVLAVMLAAVSAPAFAQDTATADSSVTIIIPITVDKTADLIFGTVARPVLAAGSGTVSIDPASGNRTVGGDAAPVSGTTPGRAIFTVAGDGSRAYTATIPASFVLSNGTASQDITVALSSTLGDTGQVSTALTTGAATIGVGGDFTITGATPATLYEGSFTVSVAYN